MENPRDEEVQDLTEGVEENLDEGWERTNYSQRKVKQKNRQKRSWTPIIILIGAIVILSLIIQWAAGSRKSQEYKKVMARLEALENRVTSLENKLQSASQILSEISKLKSQVGGLETSINALSKRVDRLSNQTKLAKKKSVSSGHKAGATRKHVVRRGETLFGIAKKYGVDINAIRTANGLNTKSVLHPGQTLVIPSK